MSAYKSLVFIVIIGGFFMLCMVIRPPDFILSERRVPAGYPRPDAGDIASGEFMEDFELAVTDNFPFRESFRTLRAATVFGAFLQTDKDGLYTDEYGVGKITPADAESVGRVTEKINRLAGGLEGMNIYCSFIPDKSYYSGKKLPGFDPAAVRAAFTPNGRFIDITDTLGAESFYRTDLHWNQTRLSGTAETLVNAMLEETERVTGLLTGFTENYAGEFEGVYAGQIALPVGGDGMYYLDNPNLEARYLNARGTGFEQGAVYDAEKLTGVDPYDFFLRGAQPLAVIKNKAPLTDRELFVFRDSFSSSLAPLLAGAYRQVTLIDLRYTGMAQVRDLVAFPPGSDVLFLYSSQILNNPGALLV